jgi:hypothetical protein
MELTNIELTQIINSLLSRLGGVVVSVLATGPKGQGWDLMMEAVRTSETSVDNYFTRQYIPEDNSENHLCKIRHTQSAYKWIGEILYRGLNLPQPHFSIHQFKIFSKLRTVPWLRSLAAGLSPRRPGFAPGSIHVGFVVDKVALAQVFLRVLRFSPVNIIPPSLQTHIIWGMRNMLT